MNDQVQKKGMSKGCLVALIIVGVLIIAVVVGGIVCYANRDKLVKFGAVTIIEQVKQHVATDPQPGVDTVAVNAVADGLKDHIQQQETLDMEGLGMLMQDLQPYASDVKIDSIDASRFIDAAVKYLPSLADRIPVPLEVAPDSTAVEETL